ncbi:MAG: UvrD-helicase domain-containing protein, partial [Candidatus Margulisiibacteriota bacterium]
MDFLPEQKAAIETIDRNICVSAGAGSGKTTVLAERYLYITRNELENISDFSLDNILALTFSEEAANEIKKRIAKKLEAGGLGRLVPQLENSYISTIHAFCHRLLRENVFEAGLDPDFEVLDDIQAGAFLRETLEETLQKLFRDQDPQLLKLLAIFPANSLKDDLLDIYGRLGSFDLDAGEIILPPVSAEEPIKELRKWLDILTSGQGCKAPTAPVQKQMETAQADVIPALDKILSATPTAKTIEQLEGLKKKLNKKSGCASFKEAVDGYKSALETISSIMADTISLTYREGFRSVLQAFSAAVEVKKKEQSVLDFDSLQTSAEKLLLAHPDLLKNYQD